MEHINIIQEEVACKDESQIMKGRRSKRQRAPSPLRLAIAMPSTTYTTNKDITTTTEEEADMANCLILLAKGKFISHPIKEEGPYLYHCKTCERGFPSFRALGGHRARHKKMKPDSYEDYCTSTTLSLQLSSDNRLTLYSAHNKLSSSKVHECSICGAEFSSGQALGGHMRRHRTLMNPSSANTIIRGSNQSHEDVKKSNRNVFNLDLNLPAPDDEDHDSKFSFHTNDSVLNVLSTSHLVDCHY